MPIVSMRRSALALSAVSLSALMFGLEISSIPAILPTLEQVLHADFKQLQWIMNAYTIACTTVLMASGTLADRYGRKRIFVMSLALFGLTSLLCGVAWSSSVLIAGRFLQGIGAGAMVICQVAILSHQFRDGEERGRAFAIWGIVFGIGLGFGPIIGAAIVALLSWHWVFLIHVLLAALTLALVHGNVDESRDPDAKHMDALGMLTLSLAVFGLTFFIIQGRDFGFGSSIVIVALTAACFMAFLLAEKFHSRPMFDFSVFRIRSFSGAILGSMGMNFSFWPFMIYLPLYFQVALGYDTVSAGLALLAYTLPTLLVPPFGERLSLRYRPGVVIPLGLFTIGLGFMLMWYGSRLAQPSWLSMLPGALLAGIGLGLTNTPVTNTTTGSVSSERVGMASGIDLSARLICLAINIAVMGLVLVEGISGYIDDALEGAVSADRVRNLAEGVASGEVLSLERMMPELTRLDDSARIVDAALGHGFGLVMLYGGACVWLLAAASFVTFGLRRGVPAAAAVSYRTE